jgi:hypothetical protein
MTAPDPGRRALLGALAAAALVRPGESKAQDPPPEDPTKVLGSGSTPTAARSAFVNPEIAPTGIITGSSFSPLQQFHGTITPTDVQFQRQLATSSSSTGSSSGRWRSRSTISCVSRPSRASTSSNVRGTAAPPTGRPRRS